MVIASDKKTTAETSALGLDPQPHRDQVHSGHPPPIRLPPSGEQLLDDEPKLHHRQGRSVVRHGTHHVKHVTGTTPPSSTSSTSREPTGCETAGESEVVVKVVLVLGHERE